MKNRSTIVAVLIALALLLALTGCKSGGSGNVKPTQPPVATDPAEPTFAAFGGMGPWSYERCGKINAADIDAAMSAGQGNIITIKSRTLDTGDYSMLVAKVHQYNAKVVLIAQEGDPAKAARFILQAQADFGTDRILGAFIEPDEPDLCGDYDPAALDRLAGHLRAAGAAVPLGTNFSVAVGFPGFGIEMVKARGVPQSLDFVAIEGYHITEERWHLVMGPACREVLAMLPAGMQIAMVDAAWADHGQPDPTPGMVKAPYTWWTGEQFAAFADRLIFWLNYRWSTDRCTSDCRIATDVMPDIQQAIREMAQGFGLI